MKATELREKLEHLSTWLVSCTECGLPYSTDDDLDRLGDNPPTEDLCWSECDGGPSDRNEGLLARLGEVVTQLELSPEIRREDTLLSASLIAAMGEHLPLAMLQLILASSKVEMKTLRFKGYMVELGEAALELDDQVREHEIGFGDDKKRLAAFNRVNTAVKAARKGKGQ